MLSTVTAVLLSACTVEGTVVSGVGDPLAGIEVVDPVRDTVLATTAPDGTFAVDAPETEGGGLVLEFRDDDWITVVRRVECGGTVSVRLAPRIYALEGFQVSATRLERSWESSPERIERLDGEEVADAAGSSPSLGEAVQQLPGVGALGRDGFTSAPTIRGMGRDRSLILLEGVRLSADRGVGPSASFLDPFLVRGVTVLRGASGVAYGSGAIGGVIVIDLGAPSDRFATAARIEGTTNGDGRLVGGRVSGTMGSGWRGTGGLFHRAAEDYAFPSDDDGPGGDAINSGYENVGGAAAFERTIGSGTLRIAGVVTNAEDVGRPTSRAGRLDTISIEDHWLTSVRYSAEARSDRTELGFGIHRPRTVNRGERFASDGTPTRVSDLENVSLDLSANALLERPLDDGGRSSWIAGMDAFWRGGADATETTVRYVAGVPGAPEAVTLIDDGRRLDLGGFIGWKRTIGFLGELRVAGRLDWARREANEQSVSDWVAPSLSIGAVVPLNDAWAVTGALGRAFRAPRIQELYFEGERPGGARAANPDLEPERAWTVETGLRWGRGPWSAEGVVWGIAADELIVQVPFDAAGDTLQYVNEETGRLGGVEIAAGWRLPDDRARATLAYALVTGENEDGDPLPDIPSGELRATLDTRVWQGGERAVRVRTALRAGGAKTPLGAGLDEKWWSGALGATDYGPDEGPHPGFARWDVGVALRIARYALVDAAVDNVLDARTLDRPEVDAYPQPGRSLRVRLTLGEE